MTLELDWQLKVRRLGPLADLVNLVFVRPRQREALYSTLVRFRRELADEAEPDRLVVNRLRAMFVFRAAVVGAGTMGGQIARRSRPPGSTSSSRTSGRSWSTPGSPRLAT